MESHPVVSEKALGGAKELASSGDSLPSFYELGNALGILKPSVHDLLLWLEADLIPGPDEGEAPEL